MSSWKSLALGDALTALTACEDIKEKFPRLAESAESAVFKRHDSETTLHCEVTVYFSPAAEELALAFGASACARPSRDGLELLAGNPACWKILFSGRD
jgi:hypothetical protein